MDDLTVRVSRRAHTTVRELADATDESMTVILDKAVEAYRRQRFLDDLNSAYAALRADVVEERDAWDVAIADGLPGSA